MTKVEDFYDAHGDDEAERLDLPLQRIELEATLRLVEKYFPSHGRVCDIGAGPGRYSVELARRGYRVSLVDLSGVLLDLARKAFAAQSFKADDFHHGDARNLSFLPSRWFDAALVLGPMYHIVDKAERRKALDEVRRILKPGAVAIVAYLNSWGLLRTGLTDFPNWYRDIDSARSLLSAQPYSAAQLTNFTDSFWSTPPAALEELTTSGFEVVSYAGVEGFCGGMTPIVQKLADTDPQAYENVVKLAVETSELPQYRDATDHLHVVVRKPR